MDETDQYTQHGTTGTGASAVMDDFQPIMILAEDKTHYFNTNGANIQYKLGFVARAVCDSNNSVVDRQEHHFKSDSTPIITATDSMFVRLDNFTQTSWNAGTGRPSKILYHIPRFDTSNREVGTGLYYEPHEKTYIRLNNSDRIMLNEIDLSICDNKEMLVDDMTGQTIIILHFRKHKE